MKTKLRSTRLFGSPARLAGEHGWPPVVVFLTVVAALLFLAFGCAAAGARQGTAEVTGLETSFTAQRAELTNALARIGKIDAALARIGPVSGHMGTMETGAIGGGGDSVTAWIYALIAGAGVFYPMIWRPGRRYLDRCLSPAERKP